MFTSFRRVVDRLGVLRRRRGRVSSDPAELGDHLTEHLISQLLPAWFPRSLDLEDGGFHQTFSRGWIPGARRPRTLVFQARMTWVSATVAWRFPEMDAAFRSHARHGLAFLGDNLWDHNLGGFRWDETGEGHKHAYGVGFGILAAAAVYKATGEPDALGLAKSAFEWLDRNAHDDEFGGYFEALAPDGSPVKVGAGASGGGPKEDRIGTPYGRKSSNTHLHLLEAFKELYRVWPDPHLGSRLEELVRLIQTHLIKDPGFFPRTYQRDWQTDDTVCSYGHDLEGIVWLMEARELLRGEDPGLAGDGKAEDPLRPVRKVLDHVLTHGYDAKNGGFFLEGNIGCPAYSRDKIWWVQAEALNTLSFLMAKDRQNTSDYLDAFRKTWSFILRHLADHRMGGWYGAVNETGKKPVDDRKSHEWKGCYHDIRALVAAPEALSSACPPGALGQG